MTPTLRTGDEDEKPWPRWVIPVFLAAAALLSALTCWRLHLDPLPVTGQLHDMGWFFGLGFTYFIAAIALYDVISRRLRK